MGCGKKEDVSNVRRHDGCVCEALRFIKRLQDVGTDEDCVECKTDCFMRPLGGLVSPSQRRFNTRVFMLLTKDGDPFKAMYRPTSVRRGSRPGTTAEVDSKSFCATNCYSVFFRVQSIFSDCCATLQVLAPFKDEKLRHPVDIIKNGKLDLEALCEAKYFGPTDTCITVDLSCFCGVQCLDDVYIDFCD